MSTNLAVVVDPDAPRVIERVKEYFNDNFVASRRWIGHACRFDDSVMRWTSL